MTPNNKNIQSEKRQFRLVKFFSSASFVVFIIFSFPLSVVISQQAKDILMNSYENYALLFGENLNHQVFQYFVLPVTNRFGKIMLSEKNQYKLMDKVVKRTVHALNIDLVNIYSIGQGVIAYSTDPELIGKKAMGGLGYKKAVKGENSSRLISGGNDLWGTGIETIGSDKKLRTFIPFKWMDPLTNKPYVGGVFELIQDLSKEYQSVVKLQYLIFIVSSLVMALIFVALLLIVRKAERMIEERATDQRKLETQLNQAERLAALGKMVAGVSHEIRNPLGIIRSTAELLEGMPDSSETQAKLSNVIIEESSRLNDIVTEFLDFARPQKPNYQDCYLDEIIKKNLDFLQPELEKKNITLHHNLGRRSLKLRADPQLTYRAVLNIFVNAIQSMNNGGALTVNVDGEKDHYIVRIEDTGSGISEKNLTKIFDPFFSTKDKGSGLGLSIVRNIIEGHNGIIWIESKEGSGARIFIKLPRGY